MRPNAPRATGTRIAFNAAVAVLLIYVGSRTGGPSAIVSYVLGGLLALSAIALAIIAYRSRTPQ
jgi:hypothetical protein